MGDKLEMGTIHAGDYLRRFCSNLGMSNEEVKAVQETVKKAGDFDIRRSPISIAAAIIFMVTQLSDSKKPLRDISIATTVAEGTIKNGIKIYTLTQPRSYRNGMPRKETSRISVALKPKQEEVFSL